MAIKVEVKYTQLQNKIARAVKEVGNLQPAFVSIASDWYKNNQLSFFATESAGHYQDLNQKYKIKKMQAVGFIYPILVFSGRLKDSVTNPATEDGLREITPTSMTIKTTVPYGAFHQSTETRSKIPYRPFLINQTLKGETMFIFRTAVKRWTRIIETYVKRRLKSL